MLIAFTTFASWHVIFGAFLTIELTSAINILNVCYGSGKSRHCFSNEAPYQMLPLPQDPTNEITPTFHLYRSLSSAIGGYARRVISSSRELKNLAENGLVVVIHGWMGDFPNTEIWQTPIIRNMLTVKPYTDVLFVEWSKGAAIKFGKDPYAQSASNTRSIAAAVGDFLLENEHFDAMKSFCIGFSLGAHVCGFMGKRFKQSAGMEGGWARISALDPSYPYFDTPNPVHRLDRGDALYVDVIHTSRLGIERPVGHVDFYVSGGVYQRGCAKIVPQTSDNVIINNAASTNHALLGRRFRRHNSLTNFVEQFTGAIEELFTCSHLRAPQIYAETIVRRNSTENCSFDAFCPCQSMAEYGRGKCSRCSPDERHTIGYWSLPADGKLPKTGSYYGDLNEKAPFCVNKNS